VALSRASPTSFDSYTGDSIRCDWQLALLAHHPAHCNVHGRMKLHAYMRALAHVYMRNVAYVHHTFSHEPTCAHAHAHRFFFNLFVTVFSLSGLYLC
jgi:hypothetical protein